MQTQLEDDDAREMALRRLGQRRALVATAVVASLAFIYVLRPFVSPILWGFGLAVVFHPLFAWFERRGLSRSLAALATLVVILFLIVMPVFSISTSVAKEAAPWIEELRAGAPNIIDWLTRMTAALPDWTKSLLGAFGVGDFTDMRERLTDALEVNSASLAASAVTLSQFVLSAVIVVPLALYLTFFFLRDAEWLWRRIELAAPLRRQDAVTLRDDFVSVTRATIRGGGLVAVIEGLIGGLAFFAAGLPSAVLAGVLMALTSFVPIVGTALVWAPGALYLAAAGRFADAVIVLCAGGVIVLCDNVLRPIVVGKGAGLPDYLVLFSTLGGIAAFGFNGIIIGPMSAAMFVSAWKAAAVSGLQREP